MGITHTNTDAESQEIPKIETNIKEFDHSSDSDDVISFTESPSECCVGIVDIVGSTKVTAKLPYSQVGKYYGTFLNMMTVIVKRFGGIVVKNGGDSLLYYFQEETKDHDSIFIRCLECSLSMIDAHALINKKLQQERLPQLDFRVSADYGKVTLATSSNSTYHDIFGSPVNFCSKINSKAEPNTTVIGGDLHQMAKGLSGYAYREVKGYSVGFKQQYPVFSIDRNFRHYISTVESAIQKTLHDLGTPVCDTITSNLFRQHGALLSDCYEHPHLLKYVLRDMFGNAHTTIIDSIRKNLGNYTEQKPILEFLENLRK